MTIKFFCCLSRSQIAINFKVLDKTPNQIQFVLVPKERMKEVFRRYSFFMSNSMCFVFCPNCFYLVSHFSSEIALFVLSLSSFCVFLKRLMQPNSSIIVLPLQKRINETTPSILVWLNERNLFPNRIVVCSITALISFNCTSCSVTQCFGIFAVDSIYRALATASPALSPILIRTAIKPKFTWEIDEIIRNETGKIEEIISVIALSCNVETIIGDTNKEQSKNVN